MGNRFLLSGLAAKIGAVLQGAGRRGGRHRLDRGGAAGAGHLPVEPEVRGARPGDEGVRGDRQGADPRGRVRVPAGAEPVLRLRLRRGAVPPAGAAAAGVSAKASVHPGGDAGKGRHDRSVRRRRGGGGRRRPGRADRRASTSGRGPSVGEDCRLYPHVTLYHGVRVGKRAILHAGLRHRQRRFRVRAVGGGVPEDPAGRHRRDRRRRGDRGEHDDRPRRAGRHARRPGNQARQPDPGGAQRRHRPATR